MAAGRANWLAAAAILSLMFLSNANMMINVEAAGRRGGGGGSACGKTPIRAAAASLSPCLSAARNARAAVPPACCSKVGGLIKAAPKCLCAVLLSPLAKQAGINPGVAITIPKRCNIRNRPAGKKCGGFTLP
ncbi:unnamed protein product [Linum trigynum]|uniref:Bifunctional inhibitor/plant lipid transfer protein/seed storage helical domain-containing protein n=2 Tax=Linum trigynum TaxID=586398 RepID=A0AAV2F2X5_9ROSI